MGEQFNFRLDPELKKAFIDKARADGKTATEFLTAFVKNYLDIAHLYS
jgi:predicted HicB family RNase H-like nuclease